MSKFKKFLLTFSAIMALIGIGGPLIFASGFLSLEAIGITSDVLALLTAASGSCLIISFIMLTIACFDQVIAELIFYLVILVVGSAILYILNYVFRIIVLPNIAFTIAFILVFIGSIVIEVKRNR